jgi:hypothetical protein
LDCGGFIDVYGQPKMGDEVMKTKPTAYLARMAVSLIPVLLCEGGAIGGYDAPADAGAGASSSGVGMIFVLLVLGGAVIAGVVIYALKRKPRIADAVRPVVDRVPPAAVDRVSPAAPPPAPDARGSVFISYRREDSADVTGRINERLTQRYGHNVVFQDIDNIPLGVDFRQHLDRALSRCDVLLAVIGDRWIEEERSVGQRRIDDPRDHLRLELEAALRRDIPVIPVLVRKAEVPSEQELPDSLKPLAFRNGIQVRPDPDFNSDMDRLFKGIQPYLSR